MNPLMVTAEMTNKSNLAVIGFCCCCIFLSANEAASVVLGPGADDNGDDTNTAIGQNTQALSGDSVALGNNSVAAAGTVSVGSGGNERKITHVAPGTTATDAATYGQLDTVQSQVSANTSSINIHALAISTNSGNISANSAAISSNSGSIAANSAGISTNSGDITSISTAIATNSGNISVNTAGITTNSSNIATNSAHISTNTISIQGLTIHTSPLASATSEPAYASGVGALALGPGASARRLDTAIGYNSTVTADRSTAVGSNTRIDSADSVAIGADAIIGPGAAGSVAIGQNAQVQNGATNSVALGKDSVASEADTVSVGSAGNERRVTNVAAGISSTDAVNKGQLDMTNTRVASNTSNIARNRSDIDQNRADIAALNNSLDELKDESRAGIAAAAALIELVPTAPGRTTFNVGSAAFKGEVAVGLTAVHRLSAAENCMLNTGVSYAGDAILVRGGLSWEF